MTGLVEIEGQLVAINKSNVAVAEFHMEDAVGEKHNKLQKNTFAILSITPNISNEIESFIWN